MDGSKSHNPAAKQQLSSPCQLDLVYSLKLHTITKEHWSEKADAAYKLWRGVAKLQLAIGACEDEGARAQRHSSKRNPKENIETHEWFCTMIHFQIILNSNGSFLRRCCISCNRLNSQNVSVRDKRWNNPQSQNGSDSTPAMEWKRFPSTHFPNDYDQSA